MTTNSTIQNALDGILIAASLGYPIAWPGQDFTPPASGYWLEVTYLPNRGVDDRLANDGHVSPQGIYQVSVVSRPVPELQLRAVAETVQSAFSPGTSITGNVRVTRAPYTTSMQSEQDRVRLSITIEYSE